MKIVLDASAILHGYNPLTEDANHYITPEALEEIKSNRVIVDQAIRFGKLKIRSPKEEFINKVKETALKTGDRLSEQDVSVLALSLELKAILYTDDYAMQNVAKKLNINVKGIRYKTNRQIVWRKVCIGCKKIYPANYDEDECEICGSPLKRKAVKIKK
ncbi:hypothetical protein J422_01890 [Methanocaldococcus villosus KIN24-T80]|uniref:Endoribonuclease Nob1 n=1 Tax=Methanocaldococcus villosus KIN24-T80 TaxID=1069083 RepID=N6VRM4_9EURY|nr:hypothetical protein J422_01890 [Methanocaldococcus villosus KIN24-T80]